ncbi:MAG: radical SAM family heme chaperone HemW [Burkholderiales bacterium]|nr:radical SAM family heme chaperone HemW [Burkholderiales bacterium]
MTSRTVAVSSRSSLITPRSSLQFSALPPLSLYIHVPWCVRKCPYCDFNSHEARGTLPEGEYVAALLADLESALPQVWGRPVLTVFIGGGTPSLLSVPALDALLSGVRARLPLAADAEITLEANPGTVEAGKFAGFRAAGVNRLSLGLQSLDDAALKFLGRNHDAAEGRRAAEAAARAFPRLSVDLIYALPDQAPDAWAAELKAAAALGAEHVSPYQLTIEAGTAFDRAVRRGLFAPPGDEAGADLYDTTQAVLEAAGFHAYEVSNHAKGEAARSRHNLVYWKGWDYVGAGPGAHGRITLAGARDATEAADRPADYIRRVGETGVGFASRETLTPVEAAEERLLSGLRIADGVPFADLAALRLEPGHPAVQGLAGLGLVAVDAGRLKATPAGRRVLDRVTAELILSGA